MNKKTTCIDSFLTPNRVKRKKMIISPPPSLISCLSNGSGFPFILLLKHSLVRSLIVTSFPVRRDTIVVPVFNVRCRLLKSVKYIRTIMFLYRHKKRGFSKVNSTYEKPLLLNIHLYSTGTAYYIMPPVR